MPKVLIVEDSPDIQRLIATFLEKAGAEVAVAENGQEAVDAVSKYNQSVAAIGRGR